MATVLVLDSSSRAMAANDDGSRSRALTAAFAEEWQQLGHTVRYRDLIADPPPHLPDSALHWPPRLRAPGAAPSAEAEAVQQVYLEELLAAHALVIGAPMYNYSLPSTVKAWIDWVHVPGITAPFDTDTTPLAGRPAVVASPRGGAYDAGMPTAGWDHTVPPLQIILGDTFGMTVEVVAPSRTLGHLIPALGAEQGDAEFTTAMDRMRELAAQIADDLD